MAKKLDIVGIIAAIVGFIVSLAIGGFFISGGFMNVFILDYLPLIVHQIVGWIIVGSTIGGAILALMKK